MFYSIINNIYRLSTKYNFRFCISITIYNIINSRNYYSQCLVSSADRAFASGAKGRRFKSCTGHFISYNILDLFLVIFKTQIS